MLGNVKSWKYIGLDLHPTPWRDRVWILKGRNSRGVQKESEVFSWLASSIAYNRVDFDCRSRFEHCRWRQLNRYRAWRHFAIQSAIHRWRSSSSGKVQG